MGDIAAVKNLLKAGDADPLAPSDTLRGWTCLQIACWGTAKSANDKDLVEAFLLWAQKKGAATEAEIRASAEYAHACCYRPPLAHTAALAAAATLHTRTNVSSCVLPAAMRG